MIRRLYYKLIPTYREVEGSYVPYKVADQMMIASLNKPKNEQWVLSKKEDTNDMIGMVHVCKRERVFN